MATDRILETLKLAAAAIDKAGGTCLGVAMSGGDHPNPSGALMEVFETCQSASRSVHETIALLDRPSQTEGA